MTLDWKSEILTSPSCSFEPLGQPEEVLDAIAVLHQLDADCLRIAIDKVHVGSCDLTELAVPADAQNSIGAIFLPLGSIDEKIEVRINHPTLNLYIACRCEASAYPLLYAINGSSLSFKRSNAKPLVILSYVVSAPSPTLSSPSKHPLCLQVSFFTAIEERVKRLLRTSDFLPTGGKLAIVLRGGSQFAALDAGPIRSDAKGLLGWDDTLLFSVFNDAHVIGALAHAEHCVGPRLFSSNLGLKNTIACPDDVSHRKTTGQYLTTHRDLQTAKSAT